MLYIAIIFHMHQPYYTDLITSESCLPWVRLHGIKDYLDMVELAAGYPKVKLTFNLVPSLIEQIEAYAERKTTDRFLDLSYKAAAELTDEEKNFIRENFFMADRFMVIAFHPRYYDLYLKRQAGKEFSIQDYLDLQVWFNLAWFDPGFRESIPELKAAVQKARFFDEADKRAVLDAQFPILSKIIPAYKQAQKSGAIEVTASPYYHPILPLLYSTTIAREANPKAILPAKPFSHPEDALAQVELALSFFRQKFSAKPKGMWPSEEAVSEHIVAMLIDSGINWIVADEAILFKSLKRKTRDTALLYQPHLLKRKNGRLNIVFRDRSLSDLIGFNYYRWEPKRAAQDFLTHLKNTSDAFAGKDKLVVIAMDGENAWEYFRNDGHDFLNELYRQLSEADFLRLTTISQYLDKFPAISEIKHLGAGSWIYADFFKWINNPAKNLAWDYLTIAREELKTIQPHLKPAEAAQALKQIYICEGSDWFWWYGDNKADFDQLFRRHLSNFYRIINKDIPEYLKVPIV